jgi:1-acyl-sn-glycerol-3-phosphate acyltransferase
MNVYQMLAYEGVRTFLGPWVAFALRVRSEGTENIPEEGGALLVCNHRSTLDPLILINEVDREIRFLMGAKGSLVPLVRTFSRMAAGAHIPINRRNSVMGIDEAVRLLEAGELVGVFPEGLESSMRPDRASGVRYFRTGFARVALEAGVPIIPAAMIPGDEIQVPIVGAALRRARGGASVEGPLKSMLHSSVLLRIGRPIGLEEFEDKPLTKSSIDMLSGKVRKVIIKLYNGEDLERFATGELPFDVYTDRI